MNRTELKVAGMNCGACVNHVTTALQSVPGVHEATVDLQAGTATVQHNEETTIDGLIAAVDEAGYSAQRP